MCEDIPPFASYPGGNKVVQIADTVAVKVGWGLPQSEATTQRYARDYVDPTILYIPEVFRYFKADGLGYIVMEYIPGDTLDKLDVSENPNLAEKTMDAVRHLASIPVMQELGPGPIGHDPIAGYVWGDNGTGCPFYSIEDMEDWLNDRLDVWKLPPISIPRDRRLNMHHMDLARRNICLRPDNSICFFDWGCAGFYPDCFETFVFRLICGQDEVWFNQLLRLSPTPQADEEEMIKHLETPGFINIKYAYVQSGAQVYNTDKFEKA
ncbi:hypothetical protein M011DRAFT_408130 [Sporormia fimetaria CBS 119925]|uniref:Aminoglycoside phosphotransferase domain-containing protein n=1 Tax=Sporormia fimetaria CBS 119925 TaxID=1340428 RepID=A0A6A6V4B7_9PLEO|nr:hypothetical protein M011DRAFT_408130 [Sporormia fimetaria CBS 119925]